MKMFSPLKWTGSKRYIAEEIISYFPKKIDNYYEPFAGGASVFINLLQSNIKINKYHISDIDSNSIQILDLASSNPNSLCQNYHMLWQYLKYQSGVKKTEFYNQIRKEFNKDKSVAAYFLFLNRTCFNGLIRYNSKGEFNTAYHLNRDGITPKNLLKILNNYSDACSEKQIYFKVRSFLELEEPGADDFLYLDPPYANTEEMYHDGFDLQKFYEWLATLKCKYALSFNGKNNKKDNTQAVPQHLYKQHIYLKESKSSFNRLQKSDIITSESLYLNY